VISSPSFQENDNIFNFINSNKDKNFFINYLENLNLNYGQTVTKGWYNHQQYRNENYHFCSAISKKNLEKLDGFDENYAKNLWYDDDEFRFRISKFLNIYMLIDELAIHLFHHNGSDTHTNSESILKNKLLYHQLLSRGNDGIISWK
jgi:GT2 family glycosyltransferase